MRFLPFSIAALLAVASAYPLRADDLSALLQRFETARIDAQTRTRDRVRRDLIALTTATKEPKLKWRESPDGPEILVVSFFPSFDATPPHTFPAGGDYWVTAVPELRTFYRAHQTEFHDPVLRIKQLLGLSPTSNYKVLVEFWVKVSDLCRPAPDPEVTDHEAELELRPSSSPSCPSKDYLDWFNRMRADLPKSFPWTALGYTYDWGSASHVGLSEFVIRSGKRVEVAGVYPVDEYLRIDPD